VGNNVDYKDIAFEDESGTIQAHINIGSGREVSIRELARTVQQVVGYQNDLSFDTTKPDGTPRKLMDSSRLMALGWQPETDLRTGIALSYQNFLVMWGFKNTEDTEHRGHRCWVEKSGT
jgi:GDP-L-fucose synthase